jgi:putative membrane protein
MKLTRTRAGFLALAVGTFSCLSCNNQTATGANIVNSDSTTIAKSGATNMSQDGKFLAKVAEINLEEIQVGSIAQQNGTTDDIKEMGKTLTDDHTQSLNILNSIARNKSIDIPTSVDNDGKNDIEKLSVKTGSEFDKAFCDMMIDGHKDAISLFEKESANTKDTAISNFIKITLPVLHKHLDIATKCQGKLHS